MERNLEDAANYKGGVFVVLERSLFPTWKILERSSEQALEEPGAPRESAC